jgi:phenylacetic acid degradation operon negative regulatory protein
LLDRYGDHLRSGAAQALLAALARLLSPAGIAAPAIRAAISRMAGPARLLPAAAPFVDCCLRAGTPGHPGPTT